MKITPIALTPPKGAEKFPKVTHELLASVLAKYSRSNEGLEAILSKVDLDNPEASIARILKFVDYGHASIGGLTGGIAIAIDGVTMWLAYKLFELSPYADGQESSTRYITMDASSLPDWDALGFGAAAGDMDRIAKEGLERYRLEYGRLDTLAREHPEIVRYPASTGNADKDAKIQDRIRKNFALDRARYFLPFALKTNVALVQTARAWTDTVSALLSLPQPEAQTLGRRIKDEVLSVFAPNLSRHARAKRGWTEDALQGLRLAESLLNTAPDQWLGDEVEVDILTKEPLRLEELQQRENRYDRYSRSIRAAHVQVRWNNMSVAELRDLNRHRTGHRFSPLAHRGFYLPPEIQREHHNAFMHEVAFLQARLAPAQRPCGLFLGSQTPFEHCLQLDKFIYEVELRTGPGAHFRYASHLRQAYDRLAALVGQDNASHIRLGEAEPE